LQKNVEDVRPCQYWEKQVAQQPVVQTQSVHIKKRQLPFKMAPLSVLRELPTLEDRIDSPGLSLMPGLEFQSSLARKAGSLSNVEGGSKGGSKGSLPGSNSDLDAKKSKIESSARRPAKLEVPTKIRKDEEFTISSPIRTHNVRVSVQKMQGASDDDDKNEKSPESQSPKLKNNHNRRVSNGDQSGTLLLPSDHDRIIQELQEE